MPMNETGFLRKGHCQWPFNLLSLFHPFRISEKIDIDFAEQFGLDINFLDLRLGVQGVGESFSFIIAKNKPQRPRYRSLY